MKRYICIVFLTLAGCKSPEQSAQQLESGDASSYMVIFGCEFPIPNHYVLRTDGENIYFNIRNSFRERMRFEEFNSRITVFDGAWQEAANDSFTSSQIYTNEDIVLERVVALDNIVMHLMSDGTKTLLFSGDDLDDDDLRQMIDRCVGSRISKEAE